jgi:ribbon-helix-helix CopG family protein
MQHTENAAVQVRLSPAEFDSLEKWRRAQEKIPPRSEAIREAIRRLVHRAHDLPDVSTTNEKPPLTEAKKIRSGGNPDRM